MAIDEPKGYISAIVGLILIALGIIPLLNKFGIIGFNLPGFLLSLIGTIITYIVAAGGLFLVIDAIMEQDALRIISFIIGLLVLAVGVIQTLASLGIIEFSIPFLSPMIFYILFVVEGLFLIIAAFAMM